MKKLIIVITTAALLLVLGIWWFSSSQVVKRRTEKLLQILSFEVGEDKGGRQMGVYSLNAILASEVSLTAASIPEANGSFPRAEMESAYSWLGQQAKQTFFEIEKIDSIKIDEAQATVNFTIEALVELPSHRPVDGHYQVLFKWQNLKDGWRLCEAQWEKLER